MLKKRVVKVVTTTTTTTTTTLPPRTIQYPCYFERCGGGSGSELTTFLYVKKKIRKAIYTHTWVTWPVYIKYCAFYYHHYHQRVENVVIVYILVVGSCKIHDFITTTTTTLKW